MPAAALDRLRTSSTGAPSATGCFGNTADTSRPTISRISSPRSISAAGRVATVRPSRSTVMRSASAADLLEAVGDVNHADLLLAQARDDVEQPFDFAFGERRGRLVHQHDPGAAADGLRNLDDLLLGHAQGVDRALRIDRRADPGEHRRRGLAPALPVNRPPGAARLQRQRDVLRHRQVGEERGLLVDRRDAQGAGGGGVDVRHVPARDAERSRVCPLGAGDDLDERRLARPVLPDERVDLAGPDVEGHPLQGADGAERLGDGEGLEQRGHGRGGFYNPGGQWRV